MKLESGVFKRVLILAGSRLWLNIYFWVFLIILKFPDADDQNIYSTAFYNSVMLFYMLFFALLSYVNNLLLLPKLLFQKRRIAYFVSALLLLLSISFLYTFTLKKLPQIYPGLNTEMSIIMSPISTDNSFEGIVNDMQSYFAFMFMWLVIFTLAGIYHHSINKLKQMEAELYNKREAELTFLKNQLNPHFLFNTLNNLYGLTLKKSEEVPSFILKLSSILRYILYESDTYKISFEKEKEIIQAYVDIELLRVTNSKFNQFTISTDQTAETSPLIWLPILENVFTHNRMLDTLEIDFSFTIQNHELNIYCKNNIATIPSLPIKKEGGIGLSNLKKRIELLYPNKHEVLITKNSESFIIELKINLN